MDSIYDLFLFQKLGKLDTLPNSGIFSISLPSGKQVRLDFQDISADDFPGFLGFDLSAIDAFDLFEGLAEIGGQWIVLNSKYRYPQIKQEAALKIAEVEMRKRHKETLPSYDFGSTFLSRSSPMYYGYLSTSEKLIQEGHCPGGLPVLVDKFDGHIWTPEEQSFMWGENYYLEMLLDGKPEWVLKDLAKKLKLRHAIEKTGEQKGKKCIKGNGLTIGAFNRGFVKIKHASGIDFDQCFWFRLNPAYYQSSYLLMLRAVNLLLYNTNDGIFLADRWIVFPILKKVSGELILNRKDSRLMEIPLKLIDLPYRLDDLEFNLFGSKNGKH